MAARVCLGNKGCRMMKHVAVVSAVVLVGGYVLLSGGGLMPGSKSSRIVRPSADMESAEAAPSTHPTETEFDVMSSSKSGRVFHGDLVTPATSPTTRPAK